MERGVHFAWTVHGSPPARAGGGTHSPPPSAGTGWAGKQALQARAHIRVLWSMISCREPDGGTLDSWTSRTSGWGSAGAPPAVCEIPDSAPKKRALQNGSQLSSGAGSISCPRYLREGGIYCYSNCASSAPDDSWRTCIGCINYGDVEYCFCSGLLWGWGREGDGG